MTWASDLVWGPWTIALLLGTGIFLTLRFRFVQILRLPEALRSLDPPGKRRRQGSALARSRRS